MSDFLQLKATESVVEIPPPKRRWTRFALPSLVLTLLLLLLAYSGRSYLIPAVPVKAVKVMVKEEQSSLKTEAPSAVIVQAPGWVEPDPFPQYVSGLIDGIIKEVLVLEGQHVRKGEVIATLIEEDAQLELKEAQAQLAMARADLNEAETNWQTPVKLQRAVEVAEANLLKVRAQINSQRNKILQKEAELKEAKAVYNSVSGLQDGSVSKLEIEKAKFAMEARKQELATNKSEIRVLEASLKVCAADLKAAKTDFELKSALKKAVERSKARCAEAESKLQMAQLTLKRTKVRATADGIVMKRVVAPGSKINLRMDGTHSSHIVHLYDPKKLQVRVDVPLAEAAKVGLGQRAKIIVDVLPDIEFDGVVTRLVHKADIQKNTTQLKVSISKPSEHLKPDMLARIKFLGKADQSGKLRGTSLFVYLPEDCVVKEKDPFVWLIESGTLVKQAVTLGSSEKDWLQVGGIKAGATVARPEADFKAGMRVKITELQE